MHLLAGWCGMAYGKLCANKSNKNRDACANDNIHRIHYMRVASVNVEEIRAK